MGYRSEIAILLSEKAVKKMENEISGDDAFDYADEVRELADGKRLYRWWCFKWHGEDVEAAQKFLDGLDSDAGECYEFMRIGESAGDVECDTTFDYQEFSVYQVIDIPEYLLDGSKVLKGETRED